MKRITFLFLAFFSIVFFGDLALADAPRGKVHEKRGYAPGRLMIQITTQAAEQMSAAMTTHNMTRGVTGLASLDALNRVHNVSHVFKAHMTFRKQNLADQLGTNRWYILEVPEETDIETLAAAYRANEHLQTAKPDWLLFRAQVPNDALYGAQWGHNNTGQMLDYCWNCGGHNNGSPVGAPGFDADAQTAWDQSQDYGDANVVVAIIDSGVDTAHPDLNLVGGYDFGDNDSDPDDDSASPGHGTACAGVAAGMANNSRGVAGIAGGCSIMPLKIANSQGSMSTSSLANAIYHAADNNADVVSMSLGVSLTSDAQVDPALQYAYQSGVILLAASGNENDNAISYPANSPYVMAVGAASPCGDRKRSSRNSNEVNPGVNTDPNGYTCDGERWWGSNYGTNVQDDDDAVDLLAPTILPTTDISGSGGYASNDYYMWFNGTSCATPYAAGVAALIKSQNPSWTPSQIRERMVTTATDVHNVESAAGWDRYSGYGLVNAGAALSDGGNTPPVAQANGPYTGQTGVAVAFSSNGSYDPDGAITSYWWSFGDGFSSSAANPSHLYTAGNTYTVSLTVTDNQGAPATDTTTATVSGAGEYISEETESNDTYSEADGPMGDNLGVSGYIDRNNTDWFYLDVQRAGTLNIVLQIGGKADLDWFLYDANLNQVARGYTTRNPETGSYYAGRTGRYYLEVDGYRRAMGAYTLTVNGNLEAAQP